MGNPGEHLRNLLQALINARSPQETRQLVETSPELLAPDADQRIRDQVETTADPLIRQQMEHWRSFLLACRDIGLDEALTLESLVFVLSQEITDEDRIQVCRLGLELLEHVSIPGYWFIFKGDLANALARHSGSDWATRREAASIYREMLERIDPLRAPELRAKTVANLRSVQQTLGENRVGDLEAAIATLEGVLDAFDRDSSPADWARAAEELAIACAGAITGDLGGAIDRAIALFEQCLMLNTRETAPRDWARIQCNLGLAYMKRPNGDPGQNREQAITAFEKALAVRTRDAMPQEWAATQGLLGVAYLERLRGETVHNQEQALHAFDEALAVLTRENAPGDWANAQTNRANCYMKRIRGDRVDNIERALRGYQSALEVLTRQTAPIKWAQVMENLSCVFEMLPDENRSHHAHAMRLREQALEVRTRESLPDGWAQSLSNQANAWLTHPTAGRAESAARAIDLCLEALQVRTREARPREWVRTTMLLGQAYHRRGELDDPGRARGCFRSVLELATREAMPEEYRKCQEALGDLAARDGLWDEAVASYQEALETHELLYRAAISLEAKADVLQLGARLPHHGAYALARTGRIKEAILTVERWRARGFAEAVGVNTTSLAMLDPAERTRFEEVRDRIHALMHQMRLPGDNPGGLPFLELRTELSEERGRLDRLVEELRARHPSFLPDPAWKDLEAAAGPEHLIYLVPGEWGGMALALQHGAASVVWLPHLTRQDLIAQMDAYGGGYSRWLESRRDPGRREGWLEALDAITRWLWDAAMGPIVERIQSAGPVTLIAAGLLGLLPLHAAWRTDHSSPTGRRYAIDRLAIRYAPNAMLLLAARKMAAATSADGILAVVDPLPSKEEPLPHAGPEVAAAVQTFTNRHVLREWEATRHSVRSLLPNYQVLHFACHGYADTEHPLESGLLLASGETLSLRDFLSLQPRAARVAVLSACESGLSGTVLPDEAMGLPAGLLQAGVAAVIASLWTVADRATMMLMFRFYDSWRRRGLPPEAALREAQMWIRDSTNREMADYFFAFLPQPSAESSHQALLLADPESRDFAHPYYWAAFAYVGA